MYNTCETGCCSTNVPVKGSSHASCHCQDTHLCESPVLEKGVSNCDDGCCATTTTTLLNSGVVRQYVNALKNEHNGFSSFNANRTIKDLAWGVQSCPAPREPNYSITDSSCGSSCCIEANCKVTAPYMTIENCDTDCTPALYYEELYCGTQQQQPTCCEPDSSINYIKGLANRVRDVLSHYHCTYGNVNETIKEIPASNIYLVNHEFIDLMIDEILDCLPIQNLSQDTVKKVKYYVEQYYTYFENIDDVGSLLIGGIVALDQNLIADEVKVSRTKAVLKALKDRLEGRVYVYEQ